MTPEAARLRIREVADRLVAAGLCKAEDFAGCPESDIAAFEAVSGHRLPEVYRAYAAVMGARRGSFLRGTDMSFAYMKQDQPGFRDLIEEIGPAFAMPLRAFVFLSHQGYSFAWFDAAEGDDPHVVHADEGTAAPRLTGQIFSVWLMGAAEDEIALSREVGIIPPQ